MTTYVFPKVEVYGEKIGPCVECGKRRRRQKRIWQTESPWNTDENGLPKTRDEIRRHLIEHELPRWKALPIICKSCAETTLFIVRYRAGNWTVGRAHDHSALGEHLWEPRYDSGYVIVHAETADVALQVGAEQLTSIMEATP